MAVNKRFLLIVSLVVLICAGFWVRGRFFYPIMNRTASGETVIAFGDSLTHGSGAQRHEAWPALVAQRCGCTVINKGVPGDTTADALARLERDVMALNPRIVIVGLGGNDMLQQQPHHIIYLDLLIHHLQQQQRQRQHQILLPVPVIHYSILHH